MGSIDIYIVYSISSEHTASVICARCNLPYPVQCRGSGPEKLDPDPTWMFLFNFQNTNILILFKHEVTLKIKDEK